MNSPYDTMIGRWAICTQGKLGRVLCFKEYDGRWIAHGISVRGTAWQSIAPRYLNEADSLYVDALRVR